MVKITFEADTLAGVYAQAQEFTASMGAAERERFARARDFEAARAAPSLESAEWDKAPSAEAVAEAQAARAEDKPKRHRRTKAEMEAERAAKAFSPGGIRQVPASPELMKSLAILNPPAEIAGEIFAIRPEYQIDPQPSLVPVTLRGKDAYGMPAGDTIKVDPETAARLVRAAEQVAESLPPEDGAKFLDALRNAKSTVEVENVIEAAETHGSPELDADAAKLEAMGRDAGPTFATVEDDAPHFHTDDGAIAASPPLTFDDVKQALTRILETDGLGVAKGREFLSSFGVARLSLLDEARWPEFCAGANLLVAWPK